MLIFFLNLRFYYNDVEYRHKYLKTQHISIRKNPCFTIYTTTASPEEPPSVTSGLRVSVQPAKLASPIRLLREDIPNVYVFSAHKIFSSFCARFPNRICHFKILAMPYVYEPCSLLTRTQGSLAFPLSFEIGDTFFYIKLCWSKRAKMLFVCCDLT